MAGKLTSPAPVRTLFDTGRYYQTLLDGGFSERQAMAMTQALKIVMAEYHAYLQGMGDPGVHDVALSHETLWEESIERPLQSVYLVFGAPWRELGTLEPLGAYSNRVNTQAFISAQPVEEIREQLQIWTFPLDRPYGAQVPEHWVDPTGLAEGTWGTTPLGIKRA